MGQSPKGDEVNSCGKGVPLLNGPTEFTDRYPEPVQFTENGRRFAEKGDILFCVRGSTTGRMNYADQKYAIGRGIGAIRGNNGFPTPYVRAVIEQNLDRLLQAATGSTFPNVSRDTLNNFEVSSVGREVAIRINQFIVSLEDKVYLNSQINRTLEQMAQAIFKSWFVDFEPVKAKIAALEAGDSEEDALLAAMQAISGSSLCNADASAAGAQAALTRFQTEQPEQYAELRATAELFPSAMQDSELGEIPEGWHQSTVGHEFDVTMGQSPPGDTYNEEGDGAPFFQGRRDFGERFPSNRVYCSAPKRMANEGDTLLSVRAPVGDTNIALTNCCIGRGLAALRHKSGCSSYTYYSIIQLGQALSSYDSEGTVFGSINQKNLRAIPVVAPAIDVLAAFTRTVGSIDELIRVNSEEASTLADTRDTLLPKLLSGELSVPCNRDEIECELLSTTPELE